MITHEPKFQVGDKVKTNSMYRDYFPYGTPIKGTVESIRPLKLTDNYGRVTEIVQMVSVDRIESLNQDYFEKVD